MGSDHNTNTNLSFQEALHRTKKKSELPSNTEELTTIGIHYGTRSSSKYHKKRGTKPSMRNKSRSTFSEQVSRYRAEKIATESLTTHYIEPNEPPTAPNQSTKAAPERSLDYKNLPKYLTSGL